MNKIVNIDIQVLHRNLSDPEKVSVFLQFNFKGKFDNK